METFIDLNPAALPPRKRLKSLGSSASPPSTPTTPPPPRPSSTSTSAVRLEPLNQSALKRKIPEPNEKEERFTFSNQNVLPPRKAAMFNLRGDAPSPSPSDSEPEQPRRGRPGRKPGSSSKKPIKRQRKEDEPLYCLCRQPYDEEVFMIACDVCNDWFHGECVGMTERKAQSLKIYVCPPCTKSRAAGQRRRSVVKVREDVEVNVEDEDDDEEDQYEKENYHEYQQQRRKRAKGQPAARGRTKGTMPGSTTTSAARRRSIGANGIGGMRKSQSIIEDDTNHVVAGETDSSKEDVMPRRVCVNKDCNNAAKPQSKYCSTECGVRVATQFLEMQKAAAVAAAEPARTPSPKPSPKPCDVSLHSSSEENLVNFTLIKRSLENSPDISAADDSDLRQLESLERQRGEVEHNLRSLAAKREEFAKAVQFSTTLFAATAATHAGDDPARMEEQSADRGYQEGVEVMDCFSCGQPIPGRNFGRHIEQCYAKKEGISCPSPSMSAAPAVLSAHKLHSRTLDSGAVITYCNHFDARSGGGYCAHPLGSCPLHSDKRGSDERRLCGCPTGDFESGHCERLRSDCVKHFNWENIRKMEMKLEKKRQTQLLSSLHAEIELVRSRIRRRNQTRDDQHRTIEENGATYTRQHSPASK